MPFEPGKSGNPGGRPVTKPWADAIKRALARRADDDGRSLNGLADRLLDKALEGDMSALKELGDRLDGKPAQTIAGDADAPLVFEKIIRQIVRPDNSNG